MNDSLRKRIDLYYLTLNKMTEIELVDEFNRNEYIREKQHFKKDEVDFEVRLKVGICRKFMYEMFRVSRKFLEKKIFKKRFCKIRRSFFTEEDSNTNNIHVLFNQHMVYGGKKGKKLERIMSGLHGSSPYTKFSQLSQLFNEKKYEDCLTHIQNEMETISQVKYVHLLSLRWKVYCYKRLKKLDLFLKSIDEYNVVAQNECSWGYLMMGWHYFKPKRRDLLKIGVEVLKKASQFRKNSLVFYCRAMMLLCLGEHVKCLENLNFAIECNPYCYQALLCRIDINIFQLKKNQRDLKLAREDAERLINIKCCVESIVRGWCVLEAIREENRDNNHNEIIDFLEKHIREIPKNEKKEHLVFEVLTDAYLKTGNNEKALRTITRAIECCMKDIRSTTSSEEIKKFCLDSIGECYSTKIGLMDDDDKIISDCDRILELDKEFGLAGNFYNKEGFVHFHSRRAGAYSRKGEYEKALEGYKDELNVATVCYLDSNKENIDEGHCLESIGFSLANIARNLCMMKKYGKAYRCCLKSLSHLESLEDDKLKSQSKTIHEIMTDMQKELVGKFGVKKLLRDKKTKLAKMDSIERLEFISTQFGNVEVVKVLGSSYEGKKTLKCFFFMKFLCF